MPRSSIRKPKENLADAEAKTGKLEKPAPDQVVTCPECHGNGAHRGYVPPDEFSECEFCKGTGRVAASYAEQLLVTATERHKKEQRVENRLFILVALIATISMAGLLALAFTALSWIAKR